jgi:Flp pilus assembly pilin Flp
LPTVKRNLPIIERTAAALVQRVGGNPIVREEGQTLAEYALILTFATVVVVAAVIVLGDRLTAFWNEINDAFQSVV